MGDDSKPVLSVTELTMAFGGLGGALGTVLGPLLGAFFVVILTELIRGWAAESSLLIFATVMILCLRFVRGGLMQIIQTLSPKLGNRYAAMTGRQDP